MAYDAGTGTVVVFGGNTFGAGLLKDTWLWNGKVWSQAVSPGCTTACPKSPPAREAASIAYDAATGTVVLFGGNNTSPTTLNDTWLWNGSGWSQAIAPGCSTTCPSSPPPRIDASMAYDTTVGTAVLFEGCPSTSCPSGGLLNDTWKWNGSSWTQAVSPGCTTACPSSPSPREGASTAYDAITDSVLLFGGETSSSLSGVVNDTWQWSGIAWSQPIDPGCTSACPNSPPSRELAALAADPVSGDDLLFGGLGVGDVNDTWLWTGGMWIQEQPASVPSARYGAGMSEDPATGTTVLFGGSDGLDVGNANDTWLWDGSDWSPTCGVNTTPASRPCVLAVSPAFGPPSGGATVTIGGSGFTGAEAVYFGQAPATNLGLLNDTALAATVPAGIEGASVDVSVVAIGGRSHATPADRYTYTVAPTVTAVAPAHGTPTGGTLVEITGTNFSTTPGASTVQFGTTEAQIASAGCRVTGVGCRAGSPLSPQPSVLSSRIGSTSVACASTTVCYAVSPAGSGTVDVHVTVDGVQSAVSAGDKFLYALDPAVTGVSPHLGATQGGGSVTVTGAGLSNATGVSFGGMTAAKFSVQSDTSLTAVPPGGTAGSVVDVQVTTAAGTSATSAADYFEYLQMGDVNTDGIVNAVDALCVLRLVAKLPATQACPSPLPGNPDVNGDGVVNAIDALCVLRIVAKLPATQACPAVPAIASRSADGGSSPPRSGGAGGNGGASPTGNGAAPPGAGAAVAAGRGSSGAGQRASLHQVPAELHLAAGNEGRLTVSVDAGNAALGAWTVEISYAERALQIETCAPADGSVCNAAAGPGEVWISGASAAGLRGRQTLASLRVRGTGAARAATSLHLQAITLGDPTGEPLSVAGATASEARESPD